MAIIVVGEIKQGQSPVFISERPSLSHSLPAGAGTASVVPLNPVYWLAPET